MIKTTAHASQDDLNEVKNRMAANIAGLTGMNDRYDMLLFLTDLFAHEVEQILLKQAEPFLDELDEIFDSVDCREPDADDENMSWDDLFKQLKKKSDSE